MAARAPRNDGSSLTSQQLDGLRSKVKGKVVVKGHASDEEYRPLLERWNAMHVKEANIIVLPENEADVSETIKFIAEHTLDVAIRCGGHTYSGPSSGRGLIIDLRNMRKVSVDVEKKIAIAQGGCLAGDIERATEDVKLRVVMGAINATGCGGITTGGGIGNLSAQHGLVCDNVVAARVALADGRIVVASDTENSDLFWGIRGGGSNFGLVTEFTYKLHDCDHDVFSGVYMYTPDKMDKALELFNPLHEECVMKSDGKFAVNAIFGVAGGAVMPAFMVYYDGPEEEAKKFIKPLEDLGPMTPPSGARTVPHTASTDWAEISKMFPPDFNRIVGSSTQIDYPVSMSVLKKTVELFQQKISLFPENLGVSKLIVDLRDYTKIASVPLDATAYANRRTGMLFGIDFIWDDQKLDERMMAEAKDCIGTLRRIIKETNEQRGIADVGGHVAATTLYPLITDGEEKLVSVFGPNLQRMRELKRKYDPNVMWDKWYPVDPAELSN
ncbi:hypothetical protein Dda_0816 [Drechslerella dactyloides]|uniref:FAD-binding PCMH-type domain-containing protein n=1 Tax=Drechslerella dactyloides TaxID=74499 RepID=A0AAD6NNC3_DREDA|nr:hypothetical protein Dda_0816 [Drechslerella dactyloides]